MQSLHRTKMSQRHRSLKQQAAKTWISKLAPIANSDAFHMTPVRSIRARVQADAPLWDPTYKLYTSKYGETFAEKFRNAMDSVNTVSVEGALMAVQAESINYNARSEADKCVRKNDIKYVVFYDVVVAQTNETLALYETEYGPFLPMVDGQCSSKSAPCNYINGDSGAPQIGPFVGRELKDTDARAPYPNTYWYSFPNTAVKDKYANKTDVSRNATRRGLCDYNKLPDGITCTYNYRIAGYVPLDDVVGITAMRNQANTSKYASFADFCRDGGVEFQASVKDGKWEKSIDFWRQPQNASENAKRAAKVVSAYSAMLVARKSAQVEATVIANTMSALPSVSTLSKGNPPCYLNVKACSGQYGCKRSLYSQTCTVCTTNSTGCVVKPAEFEYPTLAKAVGTRGTTGELDVGAAPESSRSCDALLWSSVSLVAFVFALLAFVVYQQRRRVREPNLKAFLLSQSTRNGTPLPCIELAVRQDHTLPAVAVAANPVVATSQRVD